MNLKQTLKNLQESKPFFIGVKPMEVQKYINEPTALKESIYTYLVLILTVIANLWDIIGAVNLIMLAISMGVVVLGGWFKKINELKLALEVRKIDNLQQENLDLKLSNKEMKRSIDRISKGDKL